MLKIKYLEPEMHFKRFFNKIQPIGTFNRNILSLLIVIAPFFNNSLAQDNEIHHFKFEIKNKNEVLEFSKIISIDNIKNNIVEAYANTNEWENFKTLGYLTEPIVEDHKGKVFNMATSVAQMSNWDRYPTYEVYVEMMEGFANDYPSICKLEEIGTLNSGRKILALKISDNVNSDNEPEPELLYTGTMHGDEATGFVVLLALADYLLSNYGNAAFPEITNLINSSEIWINPNANPNGTYYGGNSDVSSARRYNNDNIDLNRNFPEPDGPDHPDGNSWAQETEFMMNFAENHHFTLAANFHGGAEVVNYPWDKWSALAVDDNWWQMVSREYASLAQENSPNGYLTDLNNGITNGYAWYYVTGSRQDYMNYFHNCREVTMEISGVKLVSSDDLDDHWDYNRDALIAYLNQGLNGVRGVVTNGSGQPVDAKITIEGHDLESEKSWVTTDSRAGDYARYLKAGTYNITFSADGYADRTIENVLVTDNEPTLLNVVIGDLEPKLSLNFDELDENIVKDEQETYNLELSNIGYADLNYGIAIENAATKPWISINKNNGVISAGNTDIVEIAINTSTLSEGIYTCNILISGDSTTTIPVNIEVYTRPLLELNKASIDTTLLINELINDSIILKNTGNADLNYSITIKNPEDNAWISLSQDLSGTITPGQSVTSYFEIDPNESGIGIFNTKILINGDIITTLPVDIMVDTLPYFQPIASNLVFNSFIGETDSKDITIRNIGGDSLKYTIEIIQNNEYNWVSVDKTSGSLAKLAAEQFTIHIDCGELPEGTYNGIVNFHSEYDTLNIPVQLNIDNLPEFYINKRSINFDLFSGNVAKDTVIIYNYGGGSISANSTLEYIDADDWIIINQENIEINSNDSVIFPIILDARNLQPGIFNAQISFGQLKADTLNLSLNVIANPELEINKTSLNTQVDFTQSFIDTLVLENIGGGVLNYTSEIVYNSGQDWMSLNKTSGSIFSGDTDTLIVYLNNENTISGNYEGRIVITTDMELRIPVTMYVRTPAKIELSESTVNFNLWPGTIGTQQITLTNSGESAMNFIVDIPTNESSWLSYSDASGVLNQYQSHNIDIRAIATEDLNERNKSFIPITTNAGDTNIEIILNLIIDNIEADRNADYIVYPNPFNSSITFEFNNYIPNSKLVIYNLVGGVVQEIEAETVLEGSTIFIWQNITNQIKNGLYIYKLISPQKSYSGKIYKN